MRSPANSLQKLLLKDWIFPRFSITEEPKAAKKIRKMTFQERGNMIKSLAMHLTKRKEQFYEISYRTGATRVDSWIDIEGGFGNLYANASLRKIIPKPTVSRRRRPNRFVERWSLHGSPHSRSQKKAWQSTSMHSISRFGAMLEKMRGQTGMAGMPAVVLTRTSNRLSDRSRCP